GLRSGELPFGAVPVAQPITFVPNRSSALRFMGRASTISRSSIGTMNLVGTRSTASPSSAKIRDGVESVPTRFMESTDGKNETLDTAREKGPRLLFASAFRSDADPSSAAGGLSAANGEEAVRRKTSRTEPTPAANSTPRPGSISVAQLLEQIDLLPVAV